MLYMISVLYNKIRLINDDFSYVLLKNKIKKSNYISTPTYKFNNINKRIKKSYS
jgi:hypothetical protein